MTQYRVLVVGIGSIGERHVRCFLATGKASVAVADTNHVLREEIVRRYGLEASFPNIDEALRHPFDAAVICTPAPLHVPMAIPLAARGTHLLIEKPLSTSLNGIDELKAVLQDRKTVAAVAYVYRCHPALAALHTAIQSGQYGKPVEIVASTGQHFPTYRPAYRDIYYADHQQGGGAIQDALTHLINAAEWLVGPITHVAADAAHLLLPDVHVEDTVHVLARHGNVMGVYSLNQHQAPNELTLTVICERGTLRFEYHAHRFSWISAPDRPWQESTFGPIERDRLFVAQAESFLASLNGGPILCSLSDGIQTLKATLAILKAVETKKWEPVDA